jgi:hypothetical protein
MISFIWFERLSSLFKPLFRPPQRKFSSLFDTTPINFGDWYGQKLPLEQGSDPALPPTNQAPLFVSRRSGLIVLEQEREPTGAVVDARYRLEAYATLRRRDSTWGTRRHS